MVRLLLWPEQSRSETVPLVVGTQLKVIVLPALVLKPLAGILKGLVCILSSYLHTWYMDTRAGAANLV